MRKKDEGSSQASIKSPVNGISTVLIRAYVHSCATLPFSVILHRIGICSPHPMQLLMMMKPAAHRYCSHGNFQRTQLFLGLLHGHCEGSVQH